MKPELESTLLDRALRHIADGSTDFAVAEEQIAVEPYRSSEHFALERARLFARHPLVLGPTAALLRPGDFLTCDGYGVPILVTRDQESVLHAWVNACRHRGARLVTASQGSGKTAFTCPYHAWTYGTDGRLLRITHESAFCNLRREEHGLLRLPLWERAGFIWVLPDARAELDFDGFVAPLEPDLLPLRLAEHVVFEQPTVQLRSANWKLFIEGGLETYHFRFVHGKTVYPSFFDNLAVIDVLGAHQRLILPRRTLAELRTQERRPGQLRAHSHLVYNLFPNTMLLVQPDHTTLLQFEPVSPAQTRVTTTLLVPEPPSSEKATNYWRRNRALTLAALDEDYLMAERIQEGIQEGGLSHVVFGRNEPGLAAFRRILAKALSATT